MMQYVYKGCALWAPYPQIAFLNVCMLFTVLCDLVMLEHIMKKKNNYAR